MAAIIFIEHTTLNKERKMKMPKMKTPRSGAKRYKITASGKIVRRQAGKGHLLANKDVSRKRRLSKMVEIYSPWFIMEFNSRPSYFSSSLSNADKIFLDTVLVLDVLDLKMDNKIASSPFIFV